MKNPLNLLSRTPTARPRRGAQLAALGLTAALMSACLAPEAPDAEVQTSARIYGMPLHGSLNDVVGILYEISCQDGSTVSQYVPLEQEHLPPWLLPAGAGTQHSFADLLTVLPPGQCTVTATPMQAPGVPSGDCEPLTQTVTIQAGVTNEIVMMLQCEGDPTGGLDAVAGLNHPPQISGLAVLPSKFVLTCEDATIEPIVTDPDGDDVTNTVTVTSAPAGAVYTLTQDAAGQWIFNASTPGQYTLEIEATDIFGAVTTLSFPIHVSQGDPDACDPEVCCLLPDGTTSTIDADDCAAAMGQVVADDQCAPADPICCTSGEIISYTAPGPQCPNGDQLIPNTFCEEVCCEIGGQQVTVNRLECDNTGSELYAGACVVEQCCQQPDGSYQVVQDADDCGGAFVQDALCDTSPTCCLLPDQTLTSTDVSSCVQQNGAPQDEGCETCALEPAGVPVFSACPATLTPTQSDWSTVAGSLLWRDADAIQTNPTFPFASTPMFGYVLDSDANGVVAPGDDLHMLTLGTTATSPANMDLNLVDATNGALVASYGPVQTFHKPAIADLNSDGVIELLTIDDQNHLTALNVDPATNQLVVAWQSPLAFTGNSALAVQPHDLDLDGDLEVVVGAQVFDSNGALLYQLTGVGARARVTVGDLDLDGVAEIVMSDGIYDGATGQLEHALPQSALAPVRYHEAIVQADGDPEGEIARVGNGVVEIYDQDGALLHTGASTGASVNIGAPCTADFDGDGQSEFAFVTRPPFGNQAVATRVRMHELDGTFVWERPFLAGEYHSCAAGDLDGDGAAELLVGVDDFHILEGATGATLFQDSRVQNGASMRPYGDNAIPTITDVDGDGASEVAVVWSPTTQGQRAEVVLYEPTIGWQDLGESWNAMDWYTNRLTALGRAFGAQPLPWLGAGLTQAKARLSSGVDLGVQIDGVCIDACGPGATADISIQIHSLATGVAVNTGGSIDVSLYADNAGTLQLIGTYPVSVPSPLFNSAAGQLITIPVSAIGADGLVAVVDDDGTGQGVHPECDEGNNQSYWDANPCD